MIREQLHRLGEQMGRAGRAALWLIAIAALFTMAVVNPLESRNSELEGRLARKAPVAGGATALEQPALSEKLAAFYRFFETPEQATDWIARLHAIGKASGIELEEADYRMQTTGTRVGRYEVALPVSGSYAQIRTFLDRSLAEIPVLSLDQVRFKRQNPADAAVQADLRFTVHLVQR